MDNGSGNLKFEKFIGKEMAEDIKKIVKLTDSDYQAVCGTFVTENKWEINIAKGTIGIIVSGTGMAASEFLLETNLKFSQANLQAAIEFIHG